RGAGDDPGAAARSIADALGAPAGEPGGTAVADRSDVTILLVGRGSTGRNGEPGVRETAARLSRRGGYAAVETAYVSLAVPDVPSGLDRCLRSGSRRIVVVPYVPLTGALPERVAKQTARWAADHPEADVVTAGAVDPAGDPSEGKADGPADGAPREADRGHDTHNGYDRHDEHGQHGNISAHDGHDGHDEHRRTGGHGGQDIGGGLGRHGSHAHAH
ncbi:CbiX/SirB N-terminal domain-containing protein, partial [Streptomyces sp. NPDC058953]|uniref:CbiX/SirB N-terminal domain-containing protein n=1 Tax=Streptomyces sp. NPDC058953 TaxID=3346676 RepID=UPI0036A28CEB